MWIDQAMSKLSNEKSYHRDDLYQIFVTVKDDLTDSVFRWTLYKLLLEKHLFRTDYNTYVTKQPVVLPVYKPVYSDAAGHILNLLSEKYSELPFVVFESTLMNEFLNHQIAQNTIYVQVEKGVSSYIFDMMRQEYAGGVLYKPGRQDFDRYWTKDCIVVLDLISQSPLSQTAPHEMTAEKMLVDIIAEKSIAATFSPSELPFIFDHVLAGYQVERRRLHRYAGRRGKSSLIKKYMEEE